MISQILKELILERLPALKPTPSGWYKQNCIVCTTRGHRPDTRHRLGVKFSADESIGIHCFNCSFSASYHKLQPIGKSLQHFLKLIGVEEDEIKKLVFNAYKESKLGQELSGTDMKFKPLPESAWTERQLPPDSKTLAELAKENCEDPKYIETLLYAQSRNMFDVDNLYWSPDPLYASRVIIPFYYNGKVVGHTARLTKDYKNSRIPKYLKDIPANFIFNVERQKNYDRKFVILTEGIIDAYLIDGICCLGNNINKTQIDIINRINKTIIVSPDRDKDGAELINIAIENNWMVSFPNWDDNIKDAAQATERYGRILTLQSIISGAEKKAFNIKLKRRMESYVE